MVLKLLEDALDRYAVRTEGFAHDMAKTMAGFSISYYQFSSHKRLFNFAKKHSGESRSVQREHPQHLFTQTAAVLTSMNDKKVVFTPIGGKEVSVYVALCMIDGKVNAV